MDVIKPFDPWEGSLCTCRDKFSLNPYTGCAHGCIYCYITSYIPNAFKCRPKKDLLRRVQRDLKGIERKVISISNSSDPYPPMEKSHGLIRQVLEMLSKHDHPTLIVTKSDLVMRDVDILRKFPCAVMFTITTLKGKHKKLEPYAPPPKRRLIAMKNLSENGVPVGLRLDPLIPGLSTDFKEVITKASEAGASHVVSSTFKPRPDCWKRFENAFPDIANDLSPLYFNKGERHQGSRYLPREHRLSLLKDVQTEALEHGMSFGVCREGLNLNTAKSCDGSHMCFESR